MVTVFCEFYQKQTKTTKCKDVLNQESGHLGESVAWESGQVKFLADIIRDWNSLVTTELTSLSSKSADNSSEGKCSFVNIQKCQNRPSRHGSISFGP